MSRFIFVIISAVSLVFLYKVLKRESQRVAMRVRRAEKESKTGAKGTLVQDPITGEYRVENNKF